MNDDSFTALAIGIAIAGGLMIIIGILTGWIVFLP